MGSLAYPWGLTATAEDVANRKFSSCIHYFWDCLRSASGSLNPNCDNALALGTAQDFIFSPGHGDEFGYELNVAQGGQQMLLVVDEHSLPVFRASSAFDSNSLWLVAKLF